LLQLISSIHCSEDIWNYCSLPFGIVDYPVTLAYLPEIPMLERTSLQRSDCVPPIPVHPDVMLNEPVAHAGT
jgi:hypothetical protein